MSNHEFVFTFGAYTCVTQVQVSIPHLRDLPEAEKKAGILVVCDSNTRDIANSIASDSLDVLTLTPGETSKGWQAVESILAAAKKNSLGRDGLFIGVGGGVVTDLVAFAASVYMRGARLALFPTTLLGMVDASLGGKTGFDLFNIKNLVGSFRPADRVIMATETLSTLPEKEWTSGLAELIKTAVIGDERLFDLLEQKRDIILAGPSQPETATILPDLIARSVAVKGRIVETDPKETGLERPLLNLGHTFGHALESVVGLGVLSHGEAIAWGIARACSLGRSLGITSKERAIRITKLLADYGYETGAIHPQVALQRDNAANIQLLLSAMANDKKKKAGELRFVVPDEKGTRLVNVTNKEVIIATLSGGIQ